MILENFFKYIITIILFTRSMKHVQLFEAYALKKAIELTKRWKNAGGEDRYNDIFGKGVYRLYLPFKPQQSDKADLEEQASKTNLYNAVSAILESNGYTIVSYLDGTANKIGDTRNIFKIGKLLQRFVPTLKLEFDSDPIRDGVKLLQQPLAICISRHAYDIGGMSTGRGWTSCMNLETGGNCHIVPLDVEEGTIIAYLIKPNDKNIRNPVSRLLLKPYLQKITETESKTFLHPESKIYGTPLTSFYDTVLQWAKTITPKTYGQFNLNPKLYADAGRSDVNVAPDGYDVISVVSPKLLVVSETDSDEVQLMNHEGDILLNGKSYTTIKKLSEYENNIYLTTYNEADSEVEIVKDNGEVIYKYKNDNEKPPISAADNLFVILSETTNVLIDTNGKILLSGINDYISDYNKTGKYLIFGMTSNALLFNKETHQQIPIKLEENQKLRVKQLGEFIAIGDGSNRKVYSINDNIVKVVANNVSLPRYMASSELFMIKFLDVKGNEACAIISSDKIYKIPVIENVDVDVAHIVKKVNKSDLIVVYKEDDRHGKNLLYSVKRKSFLFEKRKFDSAVFIKINNLYSNAVIVQDFRTGIVDVVDETIILDTKYIMVDQITPNKPRKGVFFKYNYYDDTDTGVQGVIDSNGKIIIKPTKGYLYF